MIENTFIYLFGFAGTGKLTIAKEIQKLLPCIIVDNHLINNPIFCLIDPDGKTKLPSKVWENTKKVKEAVFDTIKHLAKPNRNFIFTNELIEGYPECDRIFNEIQELAMGRNALFVPVRLLINQTQLEHRVSYPERAVQFKEIDVEAATRKTQNEQVYIPKRHKHFDLDTTTLTANESASAIIQYIDKS